MHAKSTAATRYRARGMTLVELVVVLVIIAAIAGLAITVVGSTAEEGREQATRVSMTNMRSAIDGPYRLHVGTQPESIADLLRKPAAVPLFNPATQRGWNGPYVRAPIARYVVGPVGLPTDENYVSETFTDDYGVDGDLAILDGYGRPIVLQVPDVDANDVYSASELRLARLVSAGVNGVVDTPRDTPLSDFPSLDSCEDDIVLYLFVADDRPQ